MNRPLDFVGIGAARSGTTTIFEYLRLHPRIYLPAAKEIPYFTVQERIDRGWEAFLEEFYSGAPPDLLWGKITPQYMESDEVPAKLFESMPEVRLFAILRNPIDRALSFYRFLRRRRAESLGFMDSFFGEGKGRLYYRRPGEYARVLEPFFELFGAERVSVLFTEDLESRPGYVLDRVLSHLGLTPGWRDAPLGRKFNRGGDRSRFVWMVSALRRLGPVRGLWRRLPEARRRAIGRWFFFEVVPKPSPPPELSEADRRRLRSYYSNQVTRLEDLIGAQTPWPEFRAAAGSASGDGAERDGQESMCR